MKQASILIISTVLLMSLYWIIEVNAAPRNSIIVGPSFPQATRRGEVVYTPSFYDDQTDQYYSSSSTSNSGGQDHPDRSGGRYPNRNNGDRYPDRNGDRHPNRNGDRYHPDRSNDTQPGSGNDNSQGQPELACSRCSRCKSGYCKSHGSGQNICC